MASFIQVANTFLSQQNAILLYQKINQFFTQYLINLQKMWNRLFNHRFSRYYINYALSYLAYGSLITTLGAILPYLSAKSGIIQTQYSFLFSCRSAGMLLGSIMINITQKFSKITHHRMLTLGSIMIFIFSFLFSQAVTTYNQGLFMLLGCIFYTVVEVQINVCLLAINSPQEMEFWMLLTHSIFGVGGLIGPIVVYFYGASTLTLLGFFVGLFGVGFYFLKSPQILKQEQLQIDQQKQEQFLLNLRRSIPISNFTNLSNKINKKITTKMTMMLSLSVFLFVGLECNYGGWISSYAVISGVASKQESTKYATLYWVWMTVARLVMVFVHATSTKKLMTLSMMGVASTALLIVLINFFGFVEFSIYLGGLLLGFSYSSIFALIFSVPTQYDLEISTKQATLIVTATTIAEGLITMLTGILMKIFTINMLFYCALVFNLILWINNGMFLKEMEIEKAKRDREKEDSNIVELIQKQ